MAGRSGGSHVMMNETKEKCSPTIKGKKLTSNSDSDASGESLSLSQESNNTEIHINKYQGLEKAVGGNPKKLNRRNSEWEIIEGLRDGQRYDIKPEPFSGYLNKKRKWPLKGWHKRYFVLDEGILKYGKSPSSVHLGKIHGSVDIGLSVISTKSKRKRIDIDAEEFIYHLKAKQYESFAEWGGQLKKHRLYRQHMLTFGTSRHLLSHQRESVAKLPLTRKLANDVVDSASNRSVVGTNSSMATQSTSSSPRATTSSPSTQIRFQTFLNDSGPLQVAATELNHTRQALSQLGKILEKLEATHGEDNFSTVDNNFSPSVMKKDRRKFGLRKKKSGGIGCGGGAGKSGSSVDLSSGTGNENNQLTANAPMPSPSKSDLDQNLISDFYVLAKDVYTSLKSVAATVQTESDRVKASSTSSPDAERTRRALNAALRQNSELRERLGSISRTSNIGDLPEPARLLLRSSLSRTSVATEFFDAQENPGSEEEDDEEDEDAEATSDASSGGSSAEDGGSVSSEPSEMADDCEAVHEDDYDLTAKAGSPNKATMTGRRSKLPAPRPTTEGLSLWNLLTRNIGKDLSQVSMPVALNEPLSMLQRMCEELEYSDLLDKAALLTDPLDRMIYVAAFAISSYSSSYLRAGSKPFNPLLGETYEAIREDRGFKFLAEQVSHHPPISACHATSKNFTFWQDLRIKTKFWGKSMEFQPSGFVHLKLGRSTGNVGESSSDSHSVKSDYYKWNKVTACVHSLFSETRWLEQYGEMTIYNEALRCDVNFVRANYWSPKRYELQGSIVDTKSKQVLTKVFGKWNEALYVGLTPSTAKCVWRPGTLPPDHDLYYNFTQFAIELNELQPEVASLLPPTDTRFRPDQRLLEEGRQEEAERVKMTLEQNQRERRKRQEALGRGHEPKWFRKGKDEDGDEVWECTGEYWTVRANCGFVNLQLEPLCNPTNSSPLKKND